MGPREQVGQPDLLPVEENLHLREMNRELHEEVARLNSVVARRDQENATLVLQLEDLRQQVGQGQGKPGANQIILFVSLSKNVIILESFL